MEKVAKKVLKGKRIVKGKLLADLKLLGNSDQAIEKARSFRLFSEFVHLEKDYENLNNQFADKWTKFLDSGKFKGMGKADQATLRDCIQANCSANSKAFMSKSIQSDLHWSKVKDGKVDGVKLTFPESTNTIDDSDCEIVDEIMQA